MLIIKTPWRYPIKVNFKVTKTSIDLSLVSLLTTLDMYMFDEMKVCLCSLWIRNFSKIVKKNYRIMHKGKNVVLRCTKKVLRILNLGAEFVKDEKFKRKS